MLKFSIASDSSLMSPFRLRAPLSKHVLLVAAALPFLVVSAGISSRPAAAQECSDCKIPSGYTTEKGTSGGGCINKLVACTCTPPGGKPTKSSQEMCLYKVSVGGNLHSVLTPGTAPTTK
jgi:hypothetical protein